MIDRRELPCWGCLIFVSELGWLEADSVSGSALRLAGGTLHTQFQRRAWNTPFFLCRPNNSDDRWNDTLDRHTCTRRSEFLLAFRRSVIHPSHSRWKSSDRNILVTAPSNTTRFNRRQTRPHHFEQTAKSSSNSQPTIHCKTAILLRRIPTTTLPNTADRLPLLQCLVSIHSQLRSRLKFSQSWKSQIFSVLPSHAENLDKLRNSAFTSISN